MSKRSAADLNGDVHDSLELTVLRLLEGNAEGLTLNHLYSQLRQMDHPECPSKSHCSRKRGPQAIWKELLLAMPSLGNYPYKGDTAFYVKRADSQQTSRGAEHACENAKPKSRHGQQGYIRRPFPRGSIIGSLDLTYRTQEKEMQAVKDLKKNVIHPTIEDLRALLSRMKSLLRSRQPWLTHICSASEMTEMMDDVLNTLGRLEDVQ